VNEHSSEEGSISHADVVHKLSWASLSALSVYVGGAGLTSVAQFIIASLAHASNFGVYSYVSAYITLLSYAATLGFTVLVVRYASGYVARARWGFARGVVWFAIRGSGLAALAASGIGLCLVVLLWNKMNPEVALTAVFGLLTVPLVTLQLVGASVVRVLGGVASALFPERVLRDGVMLTFVVVVAFGFNSNINAPLIMVGLLLGSAVAFLVIFYSAIKRVPDQVWSGEAIFQASEWWKFSLPIMVMMAMEIVMTRSAVMLLGWSGRVEEAGQFAICFSLSLLVQLPRAAVGTYFAPRVAELCVTPVHGELQALCTRAALLSFAGSAGIAMPILLVAAPLLRLFGPEFASAAHVAQVLVFGQWLASAAGPQQNLLTMTGQQRHAAIIMCSFAVLNVGLCAVMIKYYGALGAAFATVVVLLLWNVAMAVFIRSRLGLVVCPGTGKLWPRRGRRPEQSRSNVISTGEVP
jgi:O-antigen/teichoic acid export membrane protein